MDWKVELRRKLHKHPDLSHKEHNTSQIIRQMLVSFKPDKLIDWGETGLLCVFSGKKPGLTVMFRAEMDGLPIEEKSDLEYKSESLGVSHVCGHDGHMVMLLGLVENLSFNRPVKGSVVILFQPAEEVGEGAAEFVIHPCFNKIKPDMVYALHNIPGEERNKIFVKSGNITAASKGLTLFLKGKTSHAAEPEKGVSPVNALSEIIRKMNKLQLEYNNSNANIWITIVHILLGENAFGTSPGDAEVRMTLRSFDNETMDRLCKQVKLVLKEVAQNEKLDYSISYSEIFPATFNNVDCVNVIKKAANMCKLEVESLSNPYRWSEDFGYLTQKVKGGFFGIGSGLSQPALHNPDYDFPDNILESGIDMFVAIARLSGVVYER